MATAAPHVKLLRQLASAKDDYLSGAFDISWDGAKATLYLVFGRPSHAVFETGQEQIEGEAAIDALLAALPRVFSVSDWRRAMSPHETLSITIDELAGPFVRLAGSYADDPVTDESPEWWSAVDDSPDLPFGIVDFPLLPGGRPLWVEASPDEIHLSDRLSELPPSILILTGAKLRAAAVVSGGDLIDAVWIDSDDHARGETAGMALLGATKGSLAGYALDDPRVAEALTMLWRLPVAVSGVELSWLDPASMLAAFRADGLDRVLVVDAPVRGIALFSRGGLVAVYSETQRSAVASPERLRSLLSQARGKLTVMERKPRPIAADATRPVSAHEFFEPTPAEAVSSEQPTANEEAVAGEQTLASPEPVPNGAVESAPRGDGEGSAAPASSWGFRTGGDEHTEAEAAVAEVPEASTEDSEAAPREALAFEHTGFDTSAAPPPPPPDEEVAATTLGGPPPPPPAPEESEPAQKPKRSRWGFGRARKSRAEKQAAEVATALAEVAATEAEAATFAGWSVRQPNEEPQPVWQRSHDVPETSPPSSAGPEPGSDDAPAPALATAEAEDEPSTDAPSPVVEDVPMPAEGHTDTEGAAPPDTHAAHDAWDVDDLPESHKVPESVGISAEEIEPVEAETAAWSYTSTFEAAPEIEARDDATQDHDGGPSQQHDGSPAPETAGGDDGFAFASLDDTGLEPTPPAASETWLSDSWLDDVVRGDEPSAPDSVAAPESGDEAADPDEAAGDADHVILELPKPVPVLLKPGPWSWPLAEPDDDAHAAGASGEAPDETDAPDMEPAVVAVPRHEEAAVASESSVDAGFFQRDEPVGSQYVDFDEVRGELVQIGIVWLGEANAVPVTALLSSTRSTIDDFVATIDTIRGLHIDGQDPASIQAMAREMHQQAAERLCGA
jgi:hypothetical protein